VTGALRRWELWLTWVRPRSRGARMNTPLPAGPARVQAQRAKPTLVVRRRPASENSQQRDGRAPRTRNIYLASIRWLLRASGRRDVTAHLHQVRVGARELAAGAGIAHREAAPAGLGE
jgi:hypothetical protein